MNEGAIFGVCDSSPDYANEFSNCEECGVLRQPRVLNGRGVEAPAFKYGGPRYGSDGIYQISCESVTGYHRYAYVRLPRQGRLVFLNFGVTATLASNSCSSTCCKYITCGDNLGL